MATPSLRSTTAMVQPILGPHSSTPPTVSGLAPPTVPSYFFTEDERTRYYHTPWGPARSPFYPLSSAAAAAPSISTRWPFAPVDTGRQWTQNRDVRIHHSDLTATRGEVPRYTLRKPPELLNLFDDSQVSTASESGQGRQQGRAEGKRIMDDAVEPLRLANKVHEISSSSSSDESSRPDRGKKQASTSSNLSTVQSQGDGLEPFWLDKIPDSPAGHLFAEYQAKFWRMKQRGANMPIKFFNPQRGELATAYEQEEFRRLARRFRMRLPKRNERRLAKNQEYKLRRFGPAGRGNKTPQQMRATRVASLRNYMLQKLRLLVEDSNDERGADRANKEGQGQGRKKSTKRGPEWNHDNELDLMQLDAFAPFKAGDPILELYKQFLARTGRSSCIELPP